MTLNITTVHPFDPWGTKTGGIETFIWAMFRHAPDQINHTLIGVSENPSLRPLNQWQCLNVEDTPIQFLPIMTDSEPNKRSWLPLFFRFPYYLRKASIPPNTNLLLFHRIEPPITCPPAQANTVLFIHGNPLEITGPQSEVKWKYIPWLYKFAEHKAVSSSGHVHVVSQSGLHYLQEQYANQSHTFTFQPTGYNEEIFFIRNTINNNANTSLYPSPNPHRHKILFAGRLEEQKNPLLALDTFFTLRKQINAQLIIAGDGSLMPTMRQHCNDSPYKNDICFLGGINSTTLADWMNQCSVFLMTSHFEGMPITVLEALACGLPVVSTNVGEIHQTIQDGINGRIASESNPQHLAAALLEILTSPRQFQRTVCADSVNSFRNTAVMDTLYQQLLSYTQNS